MSVSRRSLLEMLRNQPEPTTQAALVKLAGLHPNTVREHLSALVGQGFVRRERAVPSGRGRPAWLYETTGEVHPADSDYAELAAVLAASLARSSADPAKAGAEAGTDWGRELARNRGAAPSTPAAAREQVMTLLDDLGFAPESDPVEPRHVRLTRCPLLEAAHRHPDVVCGVHLGIVQGAFAEYGVEATDTDLLPFAEPGACRLTLPVLPSENLTGENPPYEKK